MVRMRLLTTGFLIAFYGTLSFLGHGGLHAVQGTGACGHHFEAHASAGGCCPHHHHGHSHSHSGDSASDRTPQHEEPADTPQRDVPQPHDHDDCLICQWHAQGKTSVDAPLTVSVDAPCMDGVRGEAAVRAEFDSHSVRSRGPPLCG
ncbi:MAG: hypothetical protein AB7I48_24070 [Planctomycetaceae bacterium]